MSLRSSAPEVGGGTESPSVSHWALEEGPLCPCPPRMSRIPGHFATDSVQVFVLGLVTLSTLSVLHCYVRPVIVEIPHFAALRGKERELVVLRSENGDSWKEHFCEYTEDELNEILNGMDEGISGLRGLTEISGGDTPVLHCFQSLSCLSTCEHMHVSWGVFLQHSACWVPTIASFNAQPIHFLNGVYVKFRKIKPFKVLSILL